MEDKEKIKSKITEIEQMMSLPDFWSDKERAQDLIKELQNLKNISEGGGKYDKNNAVITLLAGAGGTDSEDFASMLYQMYSKFCDNKNWEISLIHKNDNDFGGFRNITFEVSGRGSYGLLKNESGVHRLVRTSPFNSKGARHTSFVLVEVIPRFEKINEIEINEADIKVEFTKSSGPGGQNVNKRETAVRIIHIPTNISVFVDSQRAQAQNRQKALEILEGKIYKKEEEDRIKKEKGMQISSTVSVEWGSQIRSYVLNPYKMIKDHRTDVEVRDIDSVLEKGQIDKFLEAEKVL